MNHHALPATRLGVVLTFCICLVGNLRAQVAAAPSTTSTDSGPVTVLEKYTVSEVPVENQVLPTVRPIGSVYGDDQSIVDIPRSVSSVNKAWVQDRMVKNSMDFMQFSPGVYSAADYGIPGVPQIRGDIAQVYYDGQIIPFSRNSTPLSFNAVESLDIVKGPGTAVYGPQGEGAGGYVNFVTKQPYFDRDHLEVDATLGYWTSGHSYSNPELTVDFGGPLSDKLAYRVSYLSRYGDEYYLNAKDQTQDIFVALTYLASKSLKIDWWAQMYVDRTNEDTGTNRVTQAFINNGTYISGPTSPVTSGPYAYYGIDIVTAPNLFPNAYGSLTDGSFVTIDPGTAHAVKLPAYDALVGPQDTARAKLFQTQLKITDQLSADSFFQNLTYFALGKSNKFETYGYDEYVPRTVSIQDRAEYHGNFKTGSLDHSLIAGVDFRYTEVVSYDDYTTEPFGYYDLSQPLSQVYYPGYAYENQTWGGGMQVPGKPGYSTGTEQQFTQLYDSAAFVQDNVKLTKQLSSLLGYRADYIKADTANPPFVLTALSGPLADFFGYYPISPAVYYPKGALYSVSDHKLDQSYFGSLVFKLNETQSFYFTYDHVNAVLGTANFGGVRANVFDQSGNSYNVGPNGYIVATGGTPSLKDMLDSAISTKSTLYEAGYKASMLHNTLYFAASLFQQIKVGAQLGGPNYKIVDNGLEAEMVYQPSKALTLNANLTYQAATAFGNAFFQETGNYLDYFDPATTVDGQPGTGNGATNYQIYDPPGGRMRAPGVPSFMGNVFVDYKFPCGFGFGIGPQIIGRQNADDQGALHIPLEYELDGYIYYHRKLWDLRLNITNIANQRVLDPIDVSFAGNDVIFVRKPISASVTFRYHL